jgi:4'-phosphopantetheinyl transferase EntD
MTSLEGLFPAEVSCVFSDDPPGNFLLLPDEVDSTLNMRPRRLAEFTHGRACARQALTKLGYPECPIPVGQNRAPTWPGGVVGSISHSRECAAAVVTHRNDFSGLGVDLEVSEPLDEPLLSMICRPEEIELLDNQAEKLYFAKIIFSAKEAVYKCIWPTILRFVDFHEIEIQLDTGARSFRARAHSEQLPADLIGNIRGRYADSSSLIVSAAYCQRSVETVRTAPSPTANAPSRERPVRR